MQHIRALAPPQVQAFAFAVLIALSIAGLMLWPSPSRSSPPDASCEVWDRQAQSALASLLGDRSAIAEAHLGDAVFRLKRARKYCRAGYSAWPASTMTR